MNLPYAVRESFYSISSNPLRSGLSIIGVVFGVASVVAMLAIGLGAESEIERLLDALGARNIHITADELEAEDWNQVLRSTTGLSLRDLNVVHTTIGSSDTAEVAWASAWRAIDASMPLPEAKLDVFGVTPNFRSVLGMKLLHGRSFTLREDQQGRPVCLLGAHLAKAWFGSPEKSLGRWLRIERSWLQVIGVLGSRAEPNPRQPRQAPETASSGTTQAEHPKKDPEKSERARPAESAAAAAQGAGGKTEASDGMRLLEVGDAVVMPRRSAELRLGPLGDLAPLERIVVKLSSDLDPIQMRGRLERNLLKLHRGAKVMTVTAAEEVIEQKRSTTRLFSYFLMTIAMISLIVGGIGIANVMLAGMVERIREVGLRRAIGAKRRHILWQFLSEAVTICLLGGMVGGFVGMGVSLMIGQITGWNVAFPWWGHAVAVAIATIVGIGSGLYPAMLASKISPIEALQGRA